MACLSILIISKHNRDILHVSVSFFAWTTSLQNIIISNQPLIICGHMQIKLIRSHQNGRCSAILIFSRKYILYVTKHYFSIQNTSSKLPKYKLTIPNHLPVTCGKMSPKWPMFSQLEFSLKISIIQLSRLVVFEQFNSKTT